MKRAGGGSVTFFMHNGRYENRETNGYSNRERSLIVDLCKIVHEYVSERLKMERDAGKDGAQWVCWVPPPVNVIKANFDAAI